MNIQNGGPAFPQNSLEQAKKGSYVREIVEHPGLSLRDYFAAAALTGLAASPAYTGIHEDQLAKDSFEQADAMLKAGGYVK